MKRIAFYLGIVAVLVASCSIQEDSFEAPQKEDVVFYASFEQPTEEGTRVYVNENLYLRWTADDRVSIFNKITYNQQFKFLGETGDNAGGFNRVDAAEFVTGNEIPHVVSVYPYQEATKISEEEVLTLTLPAEQHYAENTFGLGANTMVSVSSENVLLYKNVGGYLVIKLYGEGVSVSSIMLNGNNGEKLAGKASVTMPVDGDPSVEMALDATTEITLICETPVQLGATEEESTQFWFVVPTVTFSKGFSVSVTLSTGGVFDKSTSKNITIGRNSLSKMSPMKVEGETPVTPGAPEAIDLGLSVKWASFNIGASKPEEYGDYYAWGETEPYYSSLNPLVWKPGKEAGYDWPSYRWSINEAYTKYCADSSRGYNGYTDATTVLDLEDDAAHIHFGEKWRMPTNDELEELRQACSWELTSVNGVDGYQVTGPNGSSIFLPAAGEFNDRNYYGSYRRGEYWSSSIEPYYPDGADGLWFGPDGRGYFSGARCLGHTIRPVYGDVVHVESISLNFEKQVIPIESQINLRASVTPLLAGNRFVVWSSSNESVAIISDYFSVGDVEITGKSAGTAIITATTVDGGKTATCLVTVTAPSPYTVATPEAIDLGLPSGLKWASFNLGATSPEEYGDYFAWGETEPYYISQDPLIFKEGKEEGYRWPSYQWSMGSDDTMTKYCTVLSSGYDGFTDGKTVLDPEDDAAHVNLGGKWRMPTDDEFTELRNNCSWEWTSMKGINGRLVTGPNGNSIFFPATGYRTSTLLGYGGSYGFCWSSSLDTEYPGYAWRIDFNSGNVYRSGGSRCYGQSVRPVTK